MNVKFGDPASPVITGLYSNIEYADNSYGFTKLEAAAVQIAAGICGGNTKWTNPDSQKIIARCAVAIAREVLIEANK